MIVAATLLFFLALLALLYVRTHTLLAYFQQEEYDSSRYPAAVIKMRLYDVVSSVAVAVLFILDLWLRLDALALLLAAIVLAGVAWRERGYKFKKPLVETARLKRLRMLVLPILAVLALSVWWWWPLAIVVLEIVPLVIMGANALLASGQERINEGYIAEAREKLAAFEGVKIGVTGSFGKTSVKHMLAQVLALDGNKPDLTIVLDMDPEIAFRRVMARETEAALVVTGDRFEKEDLEWHRRLREAFLAIARNNVERCVVIPANQSEEALAEEIWDVMTRRFPELAAEQTA